MKKLVVALLAVLMLVALCSCDLKAVNSDVPTPSQSTSSSTSSQTGGSGAYHSIEYVLNGGEQNPLNPTRYKNGREAGVYQPTRNGYSFRGWYDNAEFEGEAITELQDFDVDLVLYAKWEANPVSIIYNLMQPDAVNNTANPKQYVFAEGSDETIEILDAVCNGYMFQGWYTTKDYQEGTKVTELSLDNTEGYRLYAKWEAMPSGMVEAPLETVPDHPAYDLPEGSRLALDMDNADKKYTYKKTPNGQTVMYWDSAKGFSGTRSLRLKSASPDLSDCAGVSFYMYNANPHGGIFVFLLWTNWGAKVYEINLDWMGWKLITINFTEQKYSFQGGATSDNFNYFGFQTDGWGANLAKDGKFTKPEYEHTYIYISDIYGVTTSSPYKADTSTFTSADYDLVKDKMRELLIGSEALNTANGWGANFSSGARYMNSMNRDADRTYLWSDLKDLTSETGVQSQYERVLLMAKAWGAHGSSYYHNEELLDAIKDALVWLNTYDVDGDGVPGVYGENVAKSAPGNWWQWSIGSPTAIVNILLCVEEGIDDALIEQVLAPVDKRIYLPGMTVANRTWIAYPCLVSSMLQEDGERAVKVIQGILDVFPYVTTGDGFYADGSMIQHNKLSYIHGYGGSFFGSITDELYCLTGTAFDIEMKDGKFSTIYTDNVFKFFFDSVEPLVYDGFAIYGSSGRGMGAGSARGVVANMIKLVSAASPDVAERYWSLLKYYETCDSNYSNIEGSVAYPVRSVYNAYRARTDVEPRSDYYFSHIFAGMDRVVTHQSNFSAVLCMSSTRIYRFEAINGAGGSGWYLGDGALFFYGSQAGAYNGTYFERLDKLMIPGTTVSSFRRDSVQYTTDTGLLNGNSFVGGVANSAGSAVSAMFLQYYTSDYLGDNFSSDLQAQKAYFFFDDEVVCIGSGINASNTSKINVGKVYTVVGNHDSVVTNSKYFVDGEEVELPTEKVDKNYTDAVVYSGAKYMTVRNFGGYYFPGANGASISIRQDIGNGYKMGQIYFDHGEAPKNATYAYVVLPEMSAEDVAAYAANPDIEVLTDSNFVTVVRENTLKQTGYVFWYGTYANGVRTSAGATILKTDNDDGTFTYNVSEPTQKLLNVTVTLDGEFDIAGGERITGVTVADGYTTITINMFGAYGADVEFTATAK